MPAASFPEIQETDRTRVRVVAVGHIDHGKSTLVGRLLHETGTLPDGKLEMLKAVSARRGMPFEWSFLLDALQTERDQGITIDTTQTRLRTQSRDVLLIDAPGHTEFLRNMITGASQADAALLLVDAAEGVRDQTRRHGQLLRLLGVRQLIIVVNKMDRIDFSAARFGELRDELLAQIVSPDITLHGIVPISARDGDGVAERTDNIAWYDGPTVIEALDRLAPAESLDRLALRLPVQAIYKFDDRRIIAGRIESGNLATGDEIVIKPAGKIARVKSIESWPQSPLQQRRHAGHSVGITLDRELFVERGDVIASVDSALRDTKQLRARIFWFHSAPLKAGMSIILRIGPNETRATVTGISNAIDPGELSPIPAGEILSNCIGDIDIATLHRVAVDTHGDYARTGRLVIEMDGRLAGGGLVLSLGATEADLAVDIVPVASALQPEERKARYGHEGAVVWLTGLPGAGKTTLGRALERWIFEYGGAPVLLDGDTLRNGLNADLGFSPEDRSENIRRLAKVASHLAQNGYIAIVAAVSPSRDDRDDARKSGSERFYEVHVATSQAVCEARDAKGHYAKARAGRLKGFTGVGSDYEQPLAPDLAIDCGHTPIKQALDQLVSVLRTSGAIRRH